MRVVIGYDGNGHKLYRDEGPARAVAPLITGVRSTRTSGYTASGSDNKLMHMSKHPIPQERASGYRHP